MVVSVPLTNFFALQHWIRCFTVVFISSHSCSLYFSFSLTCSCLLFKTNDVVNMMRADVLPLNSIFLIYLVPQATTVEMFWFNFRWTPYACFISFFSLFFHCLNVVPETFWLCYCFSSSFFFVHWFLFHLGIYGWIWCTVPIGHTSYNGANRKLFNPGNRVFRMRQSSEYSVKKNNNREQRIIFIGKKLV